MVIFRENTEDIYAGIEFANGTEDNKKFKELFKEAFPKEYAKMRFPDISGHRFQACFRGRHRASDPRGDRIGAAEQTQDREPGPQRQHHEVHRRRVQGLGLCLAKREFRNDVVTERETWILANKEKNANLAVEDNAKIVDPGFDMMSPAQQNEIKARSGRRR